MGGRLLGRAGVSFFSLGLLSSCFVSLAGSNGSWAQVVRLWDYCGNKEDGIPLHVDMVLVDDQKNRMYAEIPGSEAEKFKPLIKEGQVYVFRKFVVLGSKLAYKPFPSKQMIRFTPWTTVEQLDDGPDNKIPKYVYDLINFEEFSSRVGQVEYFVDAIGVIVGVSKIAHVHLPSNSSSTTKRVLSLKDLRNNRINLVLWGSRATNFDADTVHSIGQQWPVITIFVGMLIKSYKGENTLSGGTACKWYINEEIPEIENYFDRVYDQHEKIDWISSGEQQFKPHEQQRTLKKRQLCSFVILILGNLRVVGIAVLLQFLGSTITILGGSHPVQSVIELQCLKGTSIVALVVVPTAEPKYRISLIGTDGTATAEFVLFGKFARQIIGKSVVALIRSANRNQAASHSEHILPEIAALVLQKFTFSVSVTQKSLTQRNVSFQVNGIVAVYGKQPFIPRSMDAPATSTGHSNPTTQSQDPWKNDGDETTPQKRARLNRMVNH